VGRLGRPPLPFLRTSLRQSSPLECAARRRAYGPERPLELASVRIELSLRHARQRLPALFPGQQPCPARAQAEALGSGAAEAEKVLAAEGEEAVRGSLEVVGAGAGPRATSLMVHALYHTRNCGCACPRYFSACDSERRCGDFLAKNKLKTAYRVG
jgi:hypothetical protein